MTAYEMRISDWMSDVFSSDLIVASELVNVRFIARSGLQHCRRVRVPALEDIGEVAASRLRHVGHMARAAGGALIDQRAISLAALEYRGGLAIAALLDVGIDVKSGLDNAG